MENIEILGGRIHNLKSINVEIPKNKIIAITGVSGSGKSSLAFDLLFEEGRTRYLQAIGMPPRLESEKQFDSISGLSPTIAVEQRTVRYKNPRSTIGTRTGIYNYLRMLFAAEAIRLCPICKEPIRDDLICNLCGMKVKRLEIKHFSFNEPSGMCLNCKGRGYIREFKEEKLIPCRNMTLLEICAAASGSFADQKSWMPNLARHYKFNLETPYSKLPKKIQKIFLHGSNGKIEFNMKSKNYTHKTQKKYEGIIPHLERAMEKSVSAYRRRIIEEKFMDKILCPDCHGYRITEQARECLIGKKHIGELASMTIGEMNKFLDNLKKRNFKTSEGKAILAKILEGLKKFQLVGLSYLHLNRATRSLSGGEIQRLSLMNQTTLGLNGVILILDEPTMGMHEIEKESLGEILKELRNNGNTVIIVEHDEKLISIADIILDLGPGAGIEGGKIVFQGLLKNIVNIENSLTGKYLGRKLEYPNKSPDQKRKLHPLNVLKMIEISTNNLKEISLEIPLGLMVGIAGVSGSGKSSLISDTLVPIIQEQFKFARKQKRQDSKNKKNGEIKEETKDPLEIVKGKIEGWKKIDEIIIVNQDPIGRNRNSTPASYTGLWDYIRKLFSKQPLAKKRKYKEGHFSFNSDKGRCPACKGEGRINLSISFLDEMTVICEECNGQRYISEILDVKYEGKNIREMLDLSVKEGLKIFADEPKILDFLKIMDQIGMGYIKLGQSATTLSGGEAQRVKLAKALSSSKKTNSLFVLDEPTTGLHFDDEVKLLNLLDNLVQQGNSVIIIEHNTNILSYCDYIIELGPEGGPKGGYLIAEGKPNDLKSIPDSIIAPFLK